MLLYQPANINVQLLFLKYFSFNYTRNSFPRDAPGVVTQGSPIKVSEGRHQEFYIEQHIW